MRRRSFLILAGGLAIGAADLAFVFVFWGLRGVAPKRILQSIAAGLLGDRSYAGGMATALAGALLHFGIASAFVLAAFLAARRYAPLTRHSLVTGAAYGLLLYLAMNLVVLPLSATGIPRFDDLPWVASSIAMHVAIGVACFGFARRALAAGVRPPSPSAPRPAP